MMSVSGLKGSAIWGKAYFDDTAVVGKAKIKKEGFPLIEYTLPQDELARWTELAGKPIWDKWVKDMNAKGYSDAQQILDETVKLANTYKP